MRRFLFLMILLFSLGPIWAQDEEVLRAALYLSGASSLEEMDEYWVSRLEARQGRPVRINAVHPLAEGLLSDYQLASLSDYRSRSGDILSWEELALVDGFSREWVAAMRPFLSLESYRSPGATDTVRVRASALLRGTLSSFGGKARASGSWWRAGGAWRGSDGTFYAEATWRRHRLLVGDYNLRFGQGLALWSGFSMNSLSTLDAFIRRTSGVSPVWSYNSSSVYRGAIYEYASAHWRGAAFASLDGQVGIHADALFRNGQLGISVNYINKTVMPGWTGHLAVSIDTRWNWHGADLVGEFAFRNGSLAGLAAWRRPVGPFKLALQGRVQPSRFSGKKNGEYAFAAGTSFQTENRVGLAGKSGFGSSIPEHQASLTLDAALLPLPEVDPRRLQLRVYAGWQWQFASAWSLDVRLTERYRNYEHPRTDIRADIRYGNGPWISVFRLEGVNCDSIGFLNYLEGGYKGSAWSGYIRLAGFVIDQWNDRIYCYERDAPGTFSVPSYYGRGGTASLVGSWKHRFRWCTLKAYLRAAWMARVGRPPTPTLNIQLQCDL